jgi:LacI family transcriptional regulator
VEGYAAPQTQEVIRRVAAELGYRPNALAQQLRAGRSTVVGVLFHRLASYHAFTPALRGVEDVLRPAGYSLLVSSTDGPEDEAAALQLYRAHQVAGVVVISSLRPWSSAHLTEAARRGLPLVAINRWLDEDGVPPGADEEDDVDGGALQAVAGPLPRVLWDNAGGMRALATSLIERGHRRLGLVSELPLAEWAPVIGYRQRWAGLRRAAAAHGCPAPRRYELGGLDAARKDGVTALLALTDDVAAEALHALVAGGLAVPRDMSLTGFTDTNVAARLTPRLTTVRLPFHESGDVAARLLLAAIQGEAVPALTTLPCPVVERESSSPPFPGGGWGGEGEELRRRRTSP